MLEKQLKEAVKQSRELLRANSKNIDGTLVKLDIRKDLVAQAKAKMKHIGDLKADPQQVEPEEL